ncbi:MAG: hypothetical protein IPK33_24210 [Gemmatimonadetes bacterium]|jgi:hypothetical protein|nr:hypothetical protein [Gemmatimonadota bacterium]
MTHHTPESTLRGVAMQHAAWRTRTSLARLSVSMLSLLAACADSPSGVAASRQPGPDGASVPAVVRTNTAPLEALSRDLEAQAARDGDVALVADLQVGGANRRVVGALAIRNALRETAVPISNVSDRGTFAIPYEDQDTLRIAAAASLVLMYDSRFGFKSYTRINQLTSARFQFDMTRTISSRNVTVSSESGSQVVSRTGGDASVTWPDFIISSGCEFMATLSTTHHITWPWGTIVPSWRLRRVTTTTGGTGTIVRDCDGAPPPPPTPGTLCDDPTGAGCNVPAGGGIGGITGGFHGQREVGRSGGYKTVCDVTDWYENGVYIETTIDRCWTEVIY